MGLYDDITYADDVVAPEVATAEKGVGGDRAEDGERNRKRGTLKKLVLHKS